VNYCKKYWPASSFQVAVTPSEKKTFWDAGCNLSYQGTGFNQYACCAPN
jgi:hypothetical protein